MDQDSRVRVETGPLPGLTDIFTMPQGHMTHSGTEVKCAMGSCLSLAFSKDKHRFLRVLWWLNTIELKGQKSAIFPSSFLFPLSPHFCYYFHLESFSQREDIFMGSSTWSICKIPQNKNLSQKQLQKLTLWMSLFPEKIEEIKTTTQIQKQHLI